METHVRDVVISSGSYAASGDHYQQTLGEP